MKFSIIIPAYNAEKFIERSIKSVSNQTFHDFEIIVIDDGSRDCTLDRLYEIKENRLKIISKVNEGVSVARNTGIEAAVGDFICFLDADDEFMPEHLEVLNEMILQYPADSFFSTRFCATMMEDSNHIKMPNCTGKITKYANAVALLSKQPEVVWTGCVCIRREMFGLYGLFEPGVKLGEDTDMWRRIYVHTGIVLRDLVTLTRNRDGSEATKNYTRRFETDPLNRMPMFLSDPSIDDAVKESLKIDNEMTKVQVVRSYLLSGNKRNAWELLKDVDKTKISFLKKNITYLCFLIPSAWLRWMISKRNRGMYQ